MKFSVQNIYVFCKVFAIAGAATLFAKSDNSLFDFENIVSYIGVLIGFAITIYTFGVSMIETIKRLIFRNRKLTPETKKASFEGIIKAFDSFKEDVLAIALSLAIAFSAAIYEMTGWPSKFVLYYHPTHCGEYDGILFFKFFAFTLASIAFYDLAKAMIRLGQFLLTLLKSDYEETDKA
jgi:hypothetical protein